LLVRGSSTLGRSGYVISSEAEERRALANARAREFFEELWSRGDPWELDSSELDQSRYRRQIELLEDRRYERALELGCGAGAFTALLARIADHVTAIDVARAAVAAADRRGLDPSKVEVRAEDIMGFDPSREGSFDLVVLAETVYYLGWLYPMFDVAWLAARVFQATSSGGRLLLVNSYGGDEDWLQRPWLLHTYRDLFANVGYTLETQETISGVKNGSVVTILMSRFRKDGGA